MFFDDGKMEKMLQKYWDSPCMYCEHRKTDWENFEYKCPFFETIPDDIVSGINKHTEVYPKQQGNEVYKEKIISLHK